MCKTTVNFGGGKRETTLHIHISTSEMIHHHGASLSKQQTADLLLCHGTQQDFSLSSVSCINGTHKHQKFST